MSIALGQILGLVGRLDDSPGDDVPRERFRRFLAEQVKEVGQVRDHIEECLRTSGEQYCRALQDLVNHLGHFLEFEVEFGRYKGVQGQVGFDGLWSSTTTDFHIVVEVKTTEVYAIKTATLLSYIDQLISEQRIPSRDNVVGLYVLGRPDPELRQLENAILAENRKELRIISVEALLSLAEVMNSFDVSHEDVLAVLQPSKPKIDPLVNLMARLVAESEAETETEAAAETTQRQAAGETPTEGEPAYWITPVKSDEYETGRDCIARLVGREMVYGWGERTPGRKRLKPGDWMCFYETANGVVAHARVTSRPERCQRPAMRHPDKYSYVFGLDSPQLYLDDPTVLDPSVRGQLDAFEGRDLSKGWAWFVQSTRKISKHDFDILTRQPNDE